MHLKIELTESDLKELVIKYLEDKFERNFDRNKLTIQTKSAQNFKSVWETAEFKATYESYD